MENVLVLDKDGFLHVNVEKKQGLISLTGFDKYGYEGKTIFNRMGTEIVVDCDYLSSLISLLQKRIAIKKREVRVILPFGFTWYHTIDVEDVPKNKNEAYDFVMWKISKLIPIPKEHIDMRIEIISKEKEKSSLLIAVTFKNLINDLERCFRENGLQLTFIIPPSIAILNTVETYLTEDLMILWLDEKGFSMIVFIKGIPKYIRELDHLLSLERLDTEIFSFLSTVSKNEGERIPARLIYFDELNRKDLKDFLPEGSIQINIGELKIQQNLQIDSLNKFVIASGVID